LEESIDRVIAGPERKSRLMSQREKENTAYHEAGHALAARNLPHADPVHKISIVARGVMLGYMRLLPTEDRYNFTRSQLNDRLAIWLGGRAAESLIFNEMSTGAADDLEGATKLARRMVTTWGMSDKLGPRTFGRKEELVFLGKELHEERDYGDKIADEIDDEVRNLISQAYTRATEILTQNKAKLDQIARELIAKETLEGEELKALFEAPLPAEKATE
jgi:cell division protease FtsH